jgi:small conductance mechanosensitive channel
MEINPYLKDIVMILIIIIATIIITKLVTYFLKKTFQRWDIDITVIQVLQEIINYSIYVIAISLILKELGIDITGIAVSLGIVGVAVGFAARDIIANFISGMFILADKSFKVGDTISVSNQKGKVTKVGFRVTTITTPDNSVITIPNSAFSTSPYSNFTYMDRRRVDLGITIPYTFDLEELTIKIEKILEDFDWVNKSPKPKVMLLELSDVGVKAKITAWTSNPKQVAHYRSLMAEELKKILVIGNE